MSRSIPRIVLRCAFVGSCVLGIGLLTPLLGQQQGGAGGQNEADNMFRSLDSNKDGKLTLDEAGPYSRQMLQRIFEMADKPATGSLSRDEFQKVFDKHRSGGGNSTPRDSGQPNQPRQNEAGFPPILRALDSNRDQRLTRAELNQLTQLFDRLDANKDGALDAEELRAAERLANEPAANSSDSRSNAPNTNAPSGNAPRGNAPASGSNSGNRPRPLPNRSSSSDSSAPNTSSGSSARDNAGASRLSGVWRGWVVRGRGENPNEGEMEVELTVEGNRITGRELGTMRAPGGLGGGTFTMTGSGNTGNLDADGNAGPQDGRQFMGIYELQGDTLRWCVSNRGRQRPATMATDRGNYLLILRKQPARS